MTDPLVEDALDRIRMTMAGKNLSVQDMSIAASGILFALSSGCYSLDPDHLFEHAERCYEEARCER